jgi:hypothetical protein
MFCFLFGMWCAVAEPPPSNVINLEPRVVFGAPTLPAVLCRAPAGVVVTTPCTDDSPWVVTHSDGSPGPQSAH